MHQTILIIDDDPAIRHMLDQALTFVGYSVSATDDPASALDSLHDLAPDLILCDVLMSPMDGLEFCTRLAAMPHHQYIPTILMSGAEDVTLDQAHLNAAFLAKPFDLDTLFNTIEQVLAAHQTLRAVAVSR